MMEWHHLYVSDTDEAKRIATQIHQAIFALMAIGIMDAAAFSKIDDERTGTHFYFSPKAHPAAKSFCAKPCSVAPSRKEIGGLLFGDQTVVNRLFL